MGLCVLVGSADFRILIARIEQGPCLRKVFRKKQCHAHGEREYDDADNHICRSATCLWPQARYRHASRFRAKTRGPQSRKSQVD